MRIHPFIPGVLLACLVLATGCDPCRKLAKSDNIADKDSAAYCYYENERYEDASILFKELKGLYSASARGEKISYMHAQAKMRMGQLITAAFLFQQFIRRYPSSQYAEDAMFYIGFSYYHLSPSYELDQSETDQALESFQLFLQRFPESDRAPKVEEYIQELRNKKAKKAFHQSNLWYRLGRYRAATNAFRNVLADFPDADWREEAYYKLFASQLEWARNSVLLKKPERYEKAEQRYLRYVDKFPNGEFNRKAEKAYAKLKPEWEAAKQEIEALDQEELKEKQKDIISPADRAPDAGGTAPPTGAPGGGGRPAGRGGATPGGAVGGGGLRPGP